MSLWKRKDQKDDQALISKDLEHGALAWGPRLLCSPNFWFFVWTAEQSRGLKRQFVKAHGFVKCHLSSSEFVLILHTLAAVPDLANLSKKFQVSKMPAASIYFYLVLDSSLLHSEHGLFD